MTGTFNNTKISVPGNQMFVLYETTSTVAKKGFRALIVENGTIFIRYLFNIEIFFVNHSEIFKVTSL